MFRYLSILSVSLTAFLVLFNTAITTQNIKWKIKVRPLIKKSEFMASVVFIILMVARNLNSLSKKEFRYFAIVSAIILFFFNWIRFLVVTGAMNNILPYEIIIITYFVAFVNSLVRLCFFVGSNIDSNPENNIVYTLGGEDVPKFFKDSFNATRRLFAKSPLSPGSNGAALKTCALAATIVVAPVMLWTGWEIHLTRVATEAAADAAKISADAAKITADVAERALDDKLLKPEDFARKWDNFGNRK